MKANFILGKKQIVLASLVLVLGAAVYLNWQFAQDGGDLTIAEQVGNTASEPLDEAGAALPPDETGTEDGGILTEAGIDGADAAGTSPDGAEGDGAEGVKYLGDAQLVNANTVAGETYFAMAKLARTKSRDEAIQTISTILDDAQLTEADKQQASEKAMSITDVIETESRIENLVKAKGFEECIVYITEANANVVVKAPSGLTQDQATQIKNIVVAEGKIAGEAVSITEIN